jgi:hypothetical protein
MATPKKPQDRKPKASEAEECFTFEHEGKSYTLKATGDCLTPRFMRANRRRDDVDAFFTILEELADEDQLEVIDSMSNEEFGELSKKFYAHLGATQGESAAS